jgi:hypothetical protein
MVTDEEPPAALLELPLVCEPEAAAPSELSPQADSSVPAPTANADAAKPRNIARLLSELRCRGESFAAAE